MNLGKSIEMNKIKEGEDIYLECSVDSRPPPYKLFFKHQVKIELEILFWAEPGVSVETGLGYLY